MRIDGAALAETLLSLGLPAGPIYNTAQVVEHAHTRHRQMFIDNDWYKMTGIPIKFSRTPGSVRELPPVFSQHSRQLLAAIGYSDSEIDELQSSGVVPAQRQR